MCSHHTSVCFVAFFSTRRCVARVVGNIRNRNKTHGSTVNKGFDCLSTFLCTFFDIFLSFSSSFECVVNMGEQHQDPVTSVILVYFTIFSRKHVQHIFILFTFCWSTATKHYKECLFWSAIDVWVPVHVSTHRLCGTKNKIQKTTILFDKCIKIETKLKRNTKKCLANVMCDKRKQHTVRNWSISKTKNARMFVHE